MVTNQLDEPRLFPRDVATQMESGDSEDRERDDPDHPLPDRGTARIDGQDDRQRRKPDRQQPQGRRRRSLPHHPSLAHVHDHGQRASAIGEPRHPVSAPSPSRGASALLNPCLRRKDPVDDNGRQIPQRTEDRGVEENRRRSPPPIPCTIHQQRADVPEDANHRGDQQEPFRRLGPILARHQTKENAEEHRPRQKAEEVYQCGQVLRSHAFPPLNEITSGCGREPAPQRIRNCPGEFLR